MYKTMFSIFIELLTNKRLSRRGLAQKFYVSEKSITRYIERLINEGVPIKIKAGPGGGYELDGKYISDLRRF